DKIRSQTKPFLYLFQLVAAKDPVYERELNAKTAGTVVVLSSNQHHHLPAVFNVEITRRGYLEHSNQI
ncbi:hypothetical protein, partial [Aeromonas veronii]|uniref:hypothetical protein n=1 Tax=Aeromonas veronii TaxID=654 RepID=UPI0030053791